MVDSKYDTLCSDFAHTKYAHDIVTDHNQYDCDIRRCYYLKQHYKNANKSFDLMTTIHLYLMSCYEIKNEIIILFQWMISQ